jgi:protein-tyrosine phosphatase
MAVGLSAVAAVGDGAAYWLLLWPAVSFALVAAAYGGAGPRVFGKRPNGTLAAWAVGLLLPYLGLTWLLWHLLRLLSRERCCHEIVPGVWLGRRALNHELPAGIELIVDLTAEFPRPPGPAAGRAYVCLPTLDATAPGEEGFRELVRRLTAWPSPVYVHCAAGHGRSATVVAGLLLARGLAADARQAEATLRRIRPGVRLNRAQRALLERTAGPAHLAPAGRLAMIYASRSGRPPEGTLP